MLIFLRIVAFLTMLLALTEVVLVTLDFIPLNDKAVSTSSTSSSSRDGSTSKGSFSESLSRTCHLYGGPALLFCTGAMLYLLVRIAATQKDDAQAQGYVNAASGRGRP